MVFVAPRQGPTFVMASQLTDFGNSTVNIKSTRRAFGLFSRCHVHVLPKRRRGFGGVVNFYLSLLSAYGYWVLWVAAM